MNEVFILMDYLLRLMDETSILMDYPLRLMDEAFILMDYLLRLMDETLILMDKVFILLDFLFIQMPLLPRQMHEAHMIFWRLSPIFLNPALEFENFFLTGYNSGRILSKRLDNETKKSK